MIESGVKPGEWVVVNGLQRARPGAPVTPEGPDGQPLDEPVAARQADELQADDVQTVSASEKRARITKTGG